MAKTYTHTSLQMTAITSRGSHSSHCSRCLWTDCLIHHRSTDSQTEFFFYLDLHLESQSAQPVCPDKAGECLFINEICPHSAPTCTNAEQMPTIFALYLLWSCRLWQCKMWGDFAKRSQKLTAYSKWTLYPLFCWFSVLGDYNRNPHGSLNIKIVHSCDTPVSESVEAGRTNLYLLWPSATCRYAC